MGSYAIKVNTHPTSNPNYDITAIDGILTVTAGSGPAINGTSSYTRTFGDGEFLLDAMATNGSPLTYASSNTSVVSVSSRGFVTVNGAGSATITIKTKATESTTSTVKLVSVTIRKAKATITAQDKTMTVGSEMPKLTATVSGNLSLHPVKYTLSCDAKDAVGSYPIVVHPGNNPNYDVTVVNGTLAVTSKKTASISGAESFAKTFGGASFSLGSSLSTGQALSYTSSNTDVASVSTSGIVSIRGAGNATITVTAKENDSYAKVTKQVSITVAKAKATVTVQNACMHLGEQAPQFNASVTGQVAGHPVSYTLTCDHQDVAGAYPITVSLGSNPNYDITVTNGTLTVLADGEETPDDQENPNDSTDQDTPDTPATPVTGGFSDVYPAHWYANQEVLGYVLSHGIMHGYDNGTFGPFDPVTRGQVAVMLWNICGNPTATSAPFDDVDYSKYYGDAIRWARSEGVVNGYGNNTFAPEQAVTRQELCVMLANFAGVMQNVEIESDCSALNAINGAGDVADWARISVGWAVDNGLVSGEEVNGQHYVNPNGTAQRCAAAKMFAMLHRDVLHL